jgi:hypothetical protein
MGRKRKEIEQKLDEVNHGDTKNAKERKVFHAKAQRKGKGETV